MKPVTRGRLTIRFDGKTCIHARRCVLGLPEVFDPERRPWIDPGETGEEEIIRVIEACPSGALSYEIEGGAGEAPPPVNTLRLWENGPLELRGDIRIEGQAPRTRALVCRCGKTANPPFCDNSHRRGFTATGVPDLREDRDEDRKLSTGPVEVVPLENGSLRVKGEVEVIGADGARVARVSRVFFCRCGASGDKPFCDGSHRKIGFTKATGAGEGGD